MSGKLLLVTTILVGSATVNAVMLCARPKKDGTYSTAVKIREACKPSEAQLDPVALGLQGPGGPEGPAGPAGPPGPAFDAGAFKQCFTWSQTNDTIEVSGIRLFEASNSGQTYPVYGRIVIAPGHTCNGSNAVGLFGTAILTPDAQRLRLFLSQAGMPYGCVPGWFRLDIDTATMAGSWNVENPSMGVFAGADLMPADCTTLPPSS